MAESTNTTIESLTKYFMWHLQNRSQQQHIELINTYSAFMSCFEDAQNYVVKAKRIRDFPIRFFVEQNIKFFTKDEIRSLDLDYRLAEIDFLYFRDTNFAKKLKTSYPTSQRSKTRYQTKLNLAQILIVTSFIREELFRDFITVAVAHNVEVPLVLPQVEKHDTGAVGIGGQRT